MNRFDIIKKMTKTEMADWLCYLMIDIADEDEGDACLRTCPVRHSCKAGHHGWFDYLTKEPGTSKGIWLDMENDFKKFIDYSDRVIKEAKGEKHEEEKTI